MKVIWTPRAASDLDEAVDYIGTDKPGAALEVADRIYVEVAGLATMPHIGRIGLVPGTRELIFHPCPYIAVYKIFEEDIRILRIRHSSKQWP
ncbi:type II toxin-antitoxin system RelE/ParE family toxin [soil metagenome]